MNRNQSLLFAFASVFLGAYFWWLWNGAISAAGAGCTALADPNLYTVCIVKHSVYGSFGSVFTVLAIVFFISAYLSKK